MIFYQAFISALDALQQQHAAAQALQQQPLMQKMLMSGKWWIGNIDYIDPLLDLTTPYNPYVSHLVSAICVWILFHL